MLGRTGILEPQVSEAVARAVGFRNILIHVYAEVEDPVVLANLKRLADLDAFVAQVAWTADQRPSGA